MEFCVCFRRLLVVNIFIINTIVALLGLLLVIVGGVSLSDGNDYFSITENTATYTRVPVLLIIVGVFIIIVGAVGAAGAILSSTAIGRVMLLVYTVILGLLVICEFGGGIAAGVLRTNVEAQFITSANNTFRLIDRDPDNSYFTTWDAFQRTFKCCGVKNYSDWSTVLNITIPDSCCSSPVCTQYYQIGCVTQVISDIKTYFSGIAAGAIVIALLQIVGIFASCFIVFYKPKEKYEVV